MSRSARWAAALLVLLAPAASAQVLISGFATDLPGPDPDDAVELWNVGPTPIGLAGLSLRDGEGELRLPDVWVAGGARWVVANNATAYRDAARRDADEVEAARVGAFGLAQAADEVWLARGSEVLDGVAWGDREDGVDGWTGPRAEVDGGSFLRWYTRSDAADTDTRADWQHPERRYLGWRDGGARRFEGVGPILAYVAPDQSRRVVHEVFASAQTSIRVNIYEWRDVDLARLAVDRLASTAGLRVDVLVDEQPVGLDAEERLVRNRILQELAAAGARVRVLQHERYGFDHAKYLVVDDARVLVQSENFVPSGLPADAATGNRGWGVVVEDPRLAQALASTFDADFALDPFGARPLGAAEAADVPLPVMGTIAASPTWGTALASGGNVTLLVAPEDYVAGRNPLATIIDAAQDEVLVEHLRMPPEWRDRSANVWPNPVVDALADAAGRGVRVRVLLDGHFEDGARENLATIQSLEAAGGDVEGRLAQGDLPVLHVKGILVDGRWAVVGSTNGNLHSVAQNREVALVVEAPPVAAYFGEVFLEDWGRAAPSTGLPNASAAASAIVILMAAVAQRPRERGTRWSSLSPFSRSSSASPSSPSRGGRRLP